MTHAVSIRHLHKEYGSTVAVEDLSLEVEAGEIFGLVGPNGSGKTTTVECAQGLRHPDAGEIRVLGLDPGSRPRELRARVGSQLQESALPERIKVWEALDLFAGFAPNAGPWRPLLEDWGLGEKRDAAFADLSGGQRQRLFIALALVGRPELVFLDEMTTGLDPAARREAWTLVERIRDGGATVVLVTHFMDEAERLCDRIAVLGGGRVLAVGSPAQLVSSVDGGTRVRFTADADDLGFLERVDGVRAVRRRGARVEVEGDAAALPLVSHALVARGIVPRDMEASRPTLEEAYLRLVEGEPRP